MRDEPGSDEELDRDSNYNDIDMMMNDHPQMQSPPRQVKKDASLAPIMSDSPRHLTAINLRTEPDVDSI